MQKTDIAVNQQGSVLSYLIGVLMGDGCTYMKKNGHGSKYRTVFHLKTIDSDFADEVEKGLRQIKPEIKISRTIQKQHPNAHGKKPLHYVTTSDDFAQYLREITHNKTLIPTEAYEYPKKFIEGFLDSDGFVSINVDNKTGTIRLQVGVGKSGGYFHSIKKMLEDEGIKTGKMQIHRTNHGKVIHRIKFNPQSFLESGLRFHIARKQNRLDAYRKAVDIMGKQRVRATFNDYKGELLKVAIPYYRRAAMV